MRGINSAGVPVGAVTGVVIGGSTVIDVSILVGAHAEMVVNPVVSAANVTRIVRERNTVAPYRHQPDVIPAGRVTLTLRCGKFRGDEDDLVLLAAH